jgi:hypothetical protein
VGPAVRRRPGQAGQLGQTIPRFLDGVELPSRPPVLLHTEVMRQHLLTAVFVAEGDSRFLTWTLTAYGYRRD